ncbi:MAG: hypothetical protein QW303_08830 [Nitrososphaerota archaeon]
MNHLKLPFWAADLNCTVKSPPLVAIPVGTSKTARTGEVASDPPVSRITGICLIVAPVPRAVQVKEDTLE